MSNPALQTFDLRHPDGTVETRFFGTLRSFGRPSKVRRSNRADLTDSRIIVAARSTRGYRKAKLAADSARAARAAVRAARRAEAVEMKAAA